MQSIVTLLGKTCTACLYGEYLAELENGLNKFWPLISERQQAMADITFTSLVMSLITCHHCISFTVALVICKLQHTLKGFTSLVAQRVFTSMMRIMQPANRGLASRILCCRSQSGLFSFGCEHTIGAWIHACNTTMQYGFVLHCCDVMALCTAS